MANKLKRSSESNQSSNSSHHSVAEPPIKLGKGVCAYNKRKCVNVKYQTSPVEAESTTCKLNTPIFKNKNSKEWLELIKNMEHAAIGQNAMSDIAKYALAKRLLEDRALQAF